jgi:hypothetical protein
MTPLARWRATLAAIAEPLPCAPIAPGQLVLELPGLSRVRASVGVTGPWAAARPHPPAPIVSCPCPKVAGAGPDARAGGYGRGYARLGAYARSLTGALVLGSADYLAELALVRVEQRVELEHYAAHVLDDGQTWRPI